MAKESPSSSPTSPHAVPEDELTQTLEDTYRQRRDRVHRVCQDIREQGDYRGFSQDPTKEIRKNTMIYLEEEKVAYCAIPKVCAHTRVMDKEWYLGVWNPFPFAVKFRATSHKLKAGFEPKFFLAIKSRSI